MSDFDFRCVLTAKLIKWNVPTDYWEATIIDAKRRGFGVIDGFISCPPGESLHALLGSAGKGQNARQEFVSSLTPEGGLKQPERFGHNPMHGHLVRGVRAAVEIEPGGAAAIAERLAPPPRPASAGLSPEAKIRAGNEKNKPEWAK